MMNELEKDLNKLKKMLNANKESIKESLMSQSVPKEMADEYIRVLKDALDETKKLLPALKSLKKDKKVIVAAIAILFQLAVKENELSNLQAFHSLSLAFGAMLSRFTQEEIFALITGGNPDDKSNFNDIYG